MKRPMVYVAMAFVAGLAAASAGVVPGLLGPLAAVGAAGAGAWVFRRQLQSRAASTFLAAFGVGALLWNAHQTESIGDTLSRYAAQHPEQEKWVIEGTVRLSDLEDSQPDQRHYVVDVDTVFLQDRPYPLHGVTMVNQYRVGGPLFATQHLRLTGRLTTTIGRVNPNVSGYEDYLRSKGIHTAITVEAPEGIQTLSPGRRYSVAYWASVLRQTQAGRMARAVPLSAVAFANAIWLGYRGCLTPQEYQAYIESGTAHILSVSGIHMAMLFWAVSICARTTTRSRRLQALTILTSLTLFTLMTGLRASALRSAVMFGVYLLADVLGRDRDARTALALSAIVLLGWNPNLLYDTGFRLSFLSVASLLLFAEPIDALLGGCISRLMPHRMPKGIPNTPSPLWRLSWLNQPYRQTRGFLSASLSVLILPFPVAIQSFHILPIGSIWANMIVIPLSTAALVLCFVTQLAGLISEDLSQVFGHALGPTVWCIRSVATRTAASPWSHCTLTTPSPAAVFCFWGAALTWAAYLEQRHSRKRPLLAAVLTTACIVCWIPWQLPPMAVALDVGHGDATFIRWPDGHTMLVDGGDRTPQHDIGQNTVAPFLWCNHVRRIDCLALSHPDRDHIGGLRYLISHFTVGTLILGAYPSDRPMESELIALCARMNIPVRRVHTGDLIRLGTLEAEVLSPPDMEAATVNNQSLVLRIRWDGVRMLLPGDIESPAEARLAQSDCAATVLKVPHHGSKTSSSSALLEAVQPSLAVISTGGEHGREHVDREVLERYRRRNIPAWRTDWYGAITLKATNGLVTAYGERAVRAYPCPALPGTNTPAP